MLSWAFKFTKKFLVLNATIKKQINEKLFLNCLNHFMNEIINLYMNLDFF